MKDFEQRLVGEQPLQIGGTVAVRQNLHDVGGAVTGRQLHHAQSVTGDIESHSLGVDRDGAPIA